MTAAPNNSMLLEGKTILLGITGGIAAYKAVSTARGGLAGGSPRL